MLFSARSRLARLASLPARLSPSTSTLALAKPSIMAGVTRPPLSAGLAFTRSVSSLTIARLVLRSLGNTCDTMTPAAFWPSSWTKPLDALLDKVAPRMREPAARSALIVSAVICCEATSSTTCGSAAISCFTTPAMSGFSRS